MSGISLTVPDFLQPLFLTKIGLLALIVIFIIFTIIVSNQTATMNKTLIQKQTSGLLQIFSIILILLAISLFLTALVIL